MTIWQHTLIGLGLISAGLIALDLHRDLVARRKRIAHWRDAETERERAARRVC